MRRSLIGWLESSATCSSLPPPDRNIHHRLKGGGRMVGCGVEW